MYDNPLEKLQWKLKTVDYDINSVQIESEYYSVWITVMNDIARCYNLFDKQKLEFTSFVTLNQSVSGFSEFIRKEFPELWL